MAGAVSKPKSLVCLVSRCNEKTYALHLETSAPNSSAVDAECNDPSHDVNGRDFPLLQWCVPQSGPCQANSRSRSVYRTDSALLPVGAVLACPISCTRCGHDFYATDGFAAGIDNNKRVLRPKTLFAVVIESGRV